MFAKSSRPRLVQSYSRASKTSCKEHPVYRDFSVSFGPSSLILLLGDNSVLNTTTRDLCPSVEVSRTMETTPEGSESVFTLLCLSSYTRLVNQLRAFAHMGVVTRLPLAALLQ